jgi:hypothetical protein
MNRLSGVVFRIARKDESRSAFPKEVSLYVEQGVDRDGDPVERHDLTIEDVAKVDFLRVRANSRWRGPWRARSTAARRPT